MEIVWDEPKRLVNLEKHGLDFADLRFEFFLTGVTMPARDGRSKAVGRLRDGTIVVIYVTLGSEAISVISMRPARRDERSSLE
ncbi:BrnT family toxin [Neorhizobium petrolearium]|uniref:BrnT family toxin n=1 Tax=Neorhizobium petrolearium TaxID=515361 RepID=UPI001AEB95D3|nr:BrnT family toxin [Neorhizobium petrolearium]